MATYSLVRKPILNIIFQVNAVFKYTPPYFIFGILGGCCTQILISFFSIFFALI